MITQQKPKGSITMNRREDGRTEVLDEKGYVVFCGRHDQAEKVYNAKTKQYTRDAQDQWLDRAVRRT